MKKVVLLVIILAITACCLFPPWLKIYTERNSNIKKFKPVEYSFIAIPPDEANIVDFGRLGVQVGLLLFLGSCIVFSKYIFSKAKPKPVLTSESPPKKKRKWVAKTITCLLIFVLVGYGAVITCLYLEAEWNWSIWQAKYHELERKQSKSNESEIRNPYLKALIAGDQKEIERLHALSDSERIDAMNKKKQIQ